MQAWFAKMDRQLFRQIDPNCAVHVAGDNLRAKGAKKVEGEFLQGMVAR